MTEGSSIQGSPSTRTSAFADSVRSHVEKTVVGLDLVVERTLISLLTGGHLLLEGVPGTATTLMVQSVAPAIELDFGRAQPTPPGDGTRGVTVTNPQRRISGPTGVANAPPLTPWRGLASCSKRNSPG